MALIDGPPSVGAPLMIGSADGRKSSKRQPRVKDNRQRKIHTKSRLGCQNCKLRSVKCDELKPSCNRCTASGFTCTYLLKTGYGPLEPALQLAHAGAFQVHLGRRRPNFCINLAAPDPQIHVPITMPLQQGLGTYKLSSWDLEHLVLFYSVIVDQMGCASMRPAYHVIGPALGRKHSYLLHIYLMLAHLYNFDQAMISGTSPSRKTRAALAYHWYHGTVLHKQSIAQTHHSSTELDAIWAAAHLLTSGTIGYLESYDPETHWPNPGRGCSQQQQQQHDNLDWLRLSIGRRGLWPLVKPQRKGSLFNSLLTAFEPPDPGRPIPPDLFPKSFLSLYGLTPGLAAAAADPPNPYFVACTVLAQLLPERCDAWNVFRFTALAELVDEPFCDLLARRDHRALLLLAWWWAKLCALESLWTPRRARVEGLAICLFLEREHARGGGGDERIRELAAYPRAVFAALEESREAATARSTYLFDPDDDPVPALTPLPFVGAGAGSPACSDETWDWHLQQSREADSLKESWI